MLPEMPDLYFRIRENGALVLRPQHNARLKRVDLEEIATANVRSGAITPRGHASLSAEDRRRISEWIEARRETLARRRREEARTLCEQINLVAQWFQSQAEDEELAELGAPLLMAMHDLRSVIVRHLTQSQSPETAWAQPASAQEGSVPSARQSGR